MQETADAVETGTRSEPTAVRRVRRACWGLWAILGVVLAALAVRVGFRLTHGITGTGAGNGRIADLVYRVTGPVADRFAEAAWVKDPINGLPHVLDVESLIAMDILFFGVLAITKMALWTARRYCVWSEGRPVASDALVGAVGSGPGRGSSETVTQLEAASAMSARSDTGGPADRVAVTVESTRG